MKKKVLILTYYWPPSGGPGVQRVLKFVKYLPHFNWEPIVVTVKNGEYPAIDTSLEKEVDPDLKVYKVPSLEFYDLFRKITGKKEGQKIETYELIKEKLSWKEKIAQFVRINFLIPDARIGWNLRGFRRCLKIIRQEKPDIIFSSSPPHSLQILAFRLSRKSGVKWVADFRDPWTKSFYDKGIKRCLFSEQYNNYLERKIIRNSDCVTAVSEGVLQLLGTSAAKKTRIISNGYDADDFTFKKTKNSRFSIVYTGHIAPVQNPVNFFTALSKLIDVGKKEIKVDIFGSADQIVSHTVVAHGLTTIVSFHPYIPHRDATRLMIEADLLLLLIPKYNSRGILTGKLFEYLAANNFILGFGDEEGNAAAVIRDCKAGTMLSYDRDPFSILENQYIRWQNGQLHNGDSEEIAKYSRKNLTADMVKLFNEI